MKSYYLKIKNLHIPLDLFFSCGGKKCYFFKVQKAEGFLFLYSEKVNKSPLQENIRKLLKHAYNAVFIGGKC